MANEFEQLPNPDFKPGAVSSGYQRQNTNMYAIQTGLDTTEPHDDGKGKITIPAGGIVEMGSVVEVNGTLFKITEDITLQKPTGKTNDAFWVAITDHGNGKASADLVTRPGKWDSAKQGCYLPDGRRTLNWVSLGELDGKLPEIPEFSSPAEKGSYAVQLKAGWMFVQLASGRGGVDGIDAVGRSGAIALDVDSLEIEEDEEDEEDEEEEEGEEGEKDKEDEMFRQEVMTVLFFHSGGRMYVRVGANGGSGGNGGDGGTDNAGGGGSGGSGSGEATELYVHSRLIAKTNTVRCGKGGLGAIANANTHGSGGHGGTDSHGNNGINGDNRSVSNSPRAGRGGRKGTSGENAPSGSLGGGGGGGAGMNGADRPDGEPGGSCVIFAIV